MNLREGLSVFTKQLADILVTMVLNLQICLRELACLLHCLPIHEHSMPLHLFRSFFDLFHQLFEVFKSCVCFVRFMPKILFLFNFSVYISLLISRNTVDFCVYIISCGFAELTYSRTFFFFFFW